jgi:flagellar biosynthesis/type III secretory pathway protein FliH
MNTDKYVKEAEKLYTQITDQDLPMTLLYWLEDALTEVYEKGLEESKKIAEDLQSARDDGYEDGHDDGFDDGRREGYDEGYDVGKDAGNTEGYKDGYKDGYSEGYDAGVDYQKDQN